MPRKNKIKDTRKREPTAVMTATKMRTIFDKKKLAYKQNIGTKVKPRWDYSVTSMVLKRKSRTERRNLMFRTVKLVMNDETETFADVLKLRYDWLIPDSNGHWATDESIEMTLSNIKMCLDSLDDELNELGFEKVGLREKLSEEDRRSTSEKDLSTKLLELGLQLIEDKGDDGQLNLPM